MEIAVKIIKVLEPQSFVSQKNGNTYVSTVFIGETTNGQYSKKIAFKVMGEDKFAQMGIVVGGTYNVSFDVDSREWNGKWFTEATAWKAMRMDGESQPAHTGVQQQPQLVVQQPPVQSHDTTENVSSSNDLPF